jgi:heat shock protein HslJ
MRFLLALLLAIPSTHAMEMKPATPDPTPAETPAAEEAAAKFPASIWKVTSLSGTSPLADHPITFAIDDEGNINGDASCNRFGGAWQFGEGTVEVGPLRTTRRACEPVIMQQERKFLALLGTIAAWSIEGDELVLTGSEGQIRASRQAAAPPQE